MKRLKCIMIRGSVVGLAVAAVMGAGAVFGGTAFAAEESGGKAQVKEGWISEDGGDKYYKNGKTYTGWHYMGSNEGEKTPHWSYFGKNGVIYTGWHKMGKNEGETAPHWSYFGSNGWLRVNWQQLGKGTANPDGNTEKHWSYFGPNGWLRTNWQQLGKGTANPDDNSEKHWSYFGDNGWLRTGWQHLGRGTANPDGNSEKHWSYFGNNGWLRTGFQTMGTKANPDGSSKQHLSFFGSNGWLVTDRLINENNVQYISDSRGWLKKVESEYDKTLARAMQLVENVTKAGMTKEQKLRACYDHIRDSYPEVRPRTPHYAGEGWHTLYANDIFLDKKGNCFSTAAAFAFMAKAIGYDNVYAISVNGHGWTEIDGLVYDAERERHHKGSYFALSYNTPIGTQDALEQYQWIFNAKSPYAKIKI